MMPPSITGSASIKRAIQIRITAPPCSGKSVVSSIIATALKDMGFVVAIDDTDVIEFTQDSEREKVRKLANELARQNISVVIVEDSRR